MWINTTPVVAQVCFGATGPATPEFQRGATWVDVLLTL
jgi:hypothetical protein